jgi:perosamine synthetase
MARPVWTLMHRLAPYRDCPRAPLPVAESIEARLINIPSSPGLSRSQ